MRAGAPKQTALYCDPAPSQVTPQGPPPTHPPPPPTHSLTGEIVCWTGRSTFAFHPLAPQGAAVEVKLPFGEPDDPAMTWSINLRKQGLAWAPGGQVEGTANTVVPGGTYTIVLDDVGTP